MVLLNVVRICVSTDKQLGDYLFEGKEKEKNPFYLVGAAIFA